jgi:hypothetical protein
MDIQLDGPRDGVDAAREIKVLPYSARYMSAALIHRWVRMLVT